MNWRDLIRIARQLASGAVGGNRGRPRQAELRRAVSAAYYAMFHALARMCADRLAGVARSSRSQDAWVQTYRALEHGHARNQCNNTSAILRFPSEIRRFCTHFVDMQSQRHNADYNPEASFSRRDVTHLIDETEEVIISLERLPAADQRAFAVHVMLRLRQ